MTVTQGTATKTHVVTAVAVTGVDPDADTVSGTAAPGSDVEVRIYSDEQDRAEPKRAVTANGSGAWTVDFSEPVDTGNPDEDRTWDLVPGSQGGAQQFDNDGDSTQADWNVPNPTFSVGPDGDAVWGREWAPDDSVHVAIDDLDADALPDFEFDATTDEWGEFNSVDIGYDIKVGYNVTVTQGTVTKAHVVTAVAVTGVDPDADTVSGTAAPGSDVEVRVYSDEQDRAEPKRAVTANGSGAWTVDFSEPVDTGNPDEDRTWDLVPGSQGGAQQFDNDGDSTQADWNVPNPTFSVGPDGDGVWGREWAPDHSVHVAIDDLDADALPDFEFDATTDQWGEFNSWNIGYDIQVGYNVTVTQGSVTKAHVVTAVVVKGVDPDADTVSGTAAPGSEVDVYACTDEQDRAAPKRAVTANGSGAWTVDFSEPVDTGNPDQDRTWDLGAGSGGMAAQYDNDGDSTEPGWEVPNSPPVAVADSYATPKGTALSISAPGVLGTTQMPRETYSQPSRWSILCTARCSSSPTALSSTRPQPAT